MGFVTKLDCVVHFKPESEQLKMSASENSCVEHTRNLWNITQEHGFVVWKHFEPCDESTIVQKSTAK